MAGYEGQKSLGEVIKIRNAQFARIRKAAMAIAIIDATVTTDPRFAQQFGEQYEGDVAVDFKPLESALETDPMAQFN